MEITILIDQDLLGFDVFISEDDTSLQATMRRENTLTCWPIVTISDKDALVQTDYRRRVAHRLAAIIVDLDNYLGAGRLFAP